MIMSLINVMVISVSDQQIFYYKPYEGCSSVAIVRAQEHLPERLCKLFWGKEIPLPVQHFDHVLPCVHKSLAVD